MYESSFLFPQFSFILPQATKKPRPIDKNMEKMLAIFFVFNVPFIAAFLYPDELAQKLLQNQEGNFVNLIFTGDPQYYYPCTEYNRQCKERSRNCTEMEIVAISSAPNISESVKNFLGNLIETTKRNGPNCIQIESEFANEVQRKCIFRLIRFLEQQNSTGNGRAQRPAALIVNGDLTNFGHHFQLELFKADWLRTIPVPILVGLGNHDYENNVNDCVGNVCAERMLRWFSQEYAPSMGTGMVENLDLRRGRMEMPWKMKFEGSLAYSSRICSQTNPSNSPPFCLHSIQLHNRPDYAATIEYPTGQWQIRGSFQWLTAELGRIAAKASSNALNGSDAVAHRQIVLINLHNLGVKVGERLRSTLELWHRSLSANKQGIQLDFMVLFAHIHENHSVSIRCINGRKVPHIFIGSVPNNRFTTIRFYQINGNKGQGAEIYLLQANSNSTIQIAQMVDFKWANC